MLGIFCMFNRDLSLCLYPDLSMTYVGYVGRIDSIPKISLTKCIILRAARSLCASTLTERAGGLR
jgi:hypothetical protein